MARRPFRGLRDKRAWRRFRSNRVGLVCLAFVVALVAMAVLGVVATPKDPDAQDLLARNVGPSGEHLLGADAFGRDVLSRLLVGARTSLVAAGIALGAAVLLGVPLGIVAGYARGGILDVLASRVADVLMSLPPLILAMAIAGISGGGLRNAMLAVGLVLAPRFFRVARAEAASNAGKPFVEAARADGCSTARLLWRYILPSSGGPLLVQVSFAVGFIITAEASLSFLGLGVEPPTASWGSMLRDAYTQVNRNSFQIFPPAVMITLSVAVFAVLGDVVRDVSGRMRDAGGGRS
ncbi:MAG: ABC transporter permease [Acidimicrobiia bacterium]